jgi:transcriptional regulator with XRE-family HTH domain
MQILIDYMAATGLNKSKLARRIGVSRSTVTLWLQGKRKPCVDTLDLIAARTGIDRERLGKSVQ